jgi:large subunit ribosomal protein L1
MPLADKRYVDAIKKDVDGSKPSNFGESVEVAINLKDIDLSVPKNRIEDEIVLPKGRGKPLRVCVFGSGELAVKARGAADRIVLPEEIEEIAGDKKKAKELAEEYDFFVAEAPLMPVIGRRLGVVLGPRGKMPRPVPPGSDPTGLLNTMRNTVKVRTKDRRTFHAPVGSKAMTPEDLADNLETVLRRVMTRLERGRANIASAYVKTTMGPAVKVM